MATVTVYTKAAIDAALAPLVKDAAFDISGDLILTLQDDTTVNAGSPTFTVPDADTTTKGIVELATSAEAITGTDTTRAVTPAALDATLDSRVPDASATVKGIVELATDAEATTGTDTVRATTPANVKAVTDAITAASITPRPLGIVARRTRTSNSTATTSASGIAVIKLSWSATSGRAYRIKSNALHMTGGAADEVAARVFMTTNGVDPTTSDTEVCSAQATIENAGRYQLVYIDELVVAGSTATHKVTLFVARFGGTAGNAAIHAVNTNIKFWVEDAGVPAADAGSGADV